VKKGTPPGDVTRRYDRCWWFFNVLEMRRLYIRAARCIAAVRQNRPRCGWKGSCAAAVTVLAAGTTGVDRFEDERHESACAMHENATMDSYSK
jgi:hypothetical protein